METAHITKQMIGFQKALFDNSYTAMSVVQDYSENVVGGILKQFPWVNENVRKPWDDSMAYLKTARSDYKKAIDQGYEKLADLTNAK